MSIYLTPNRKEAFHQSITSHYQLYGFSENELWEKIQSRITDLFLNKFKVRFDNQEIETITSDEILSFLIENSEGQKQTTKRFKYTLLKTFFNFFKNTVDQTFVNPCDSPMLSKTFRLAKAGRLVGMDLRPHDLRRHAATYASRSGAPLEIVSKLILRHANLSTTQLYLGRISDTEAIRWIEHVFN